MKINFDAVIVGLDGEPLKTKKDDESSVVSTLKDYAIGALMAVYPNEQNMEGKEKLKRGLLAQDIYAGGEVDIAVEDVAMVKELIGKAYTPLVVMRSWSLLDPKPREEKKNKTG